MPPTAPLKKSVRPLVTFGRYADPIGNCVIMKVLSLHDRSSARLDELEIIRRILAGEKELFEILLRRYNQTLYRVVRGYLHDGNEVEDAMQNAYLKAFDKLSQFRGESSFSTWLIRIGINEALIQLRAQEKARTYYIGEGDSENIRQMADRQMDPEMQIVNKEGERLLEQAIDRLPEKFRVVYVLKEVEGLSNSEIAKCLDITDENVKVRIHRAKKMLKDDLYKMTARSNVLQFGDSRCDAIVEFVMKHI